MLIALAKRSECVAVGDADNKAGGEGERGIWLFFPTIKIFNS